VKKVFIIVLVNAMTRQLSKDMPANIKNATNAPSPTPNPPIDIGTIIIKVTNGTNKKK
jgi:hypothetical protein